MKYCQFCGTRLEDNQQCTCEAAQKEAARQSAAAKRPILTDAQKQAAKQAAGDMQKIAADVAKGVWSQSKDYLAGQREAMNQAPAAATTLFRQIMMAFGAVQALFFFILSYGKLDSAGYDLKKAASLVGIDIPRRLTALPAIRLMDALAEYGAEGADTVYLELLIGFGLPLVCGILLIVFNRKEKLGGMASSIALSVLTMAGYLIAHFDIVENFENCGYEFGLGFGLAFLVTGVQIVAAVIGHKTSKKAVAAE